MINNCLNCNKEFYAAPSVVNKGNGKFCSRKCWAKSREGVISPKKGTGVGKIEVKCEVCKKLFYVWPSAFKYRPLKFCSHKCARSVRIGNKSPCWKGGIKQDPTGYYLVYSPYHPNNNCNYVHRSRLIAEQELQRFLTKKEVIHHINGKKDDDRLENLYLFPDNAEHIRYHRLLKSKKVQEIIESNLSSI